MMDHDRPDDEQPDDGRPVPQPQPAGTVAVIVLERVNPAGQPSYPAYGVTDCHWCDQPVWVGVAVLEVLRTGGAPICQPCAETLFPLWNPTFGGDFDMGGG